MTPFFQTNNGTLYHGESESVLPLLDIRATACVTDPPYGLRFMGKRWDYDVPSVEQWSVIMDSLLPGAFVLSFAGSRTSHRVAVNIEDAGFEIRDTVMWVYGSGFPKSHDVSKGIDRAAGVERVDLGPNPNRIGRRQDIRGGSFHAENQKRTAAELLDRITTPATEAAQHWNGYGTALKPAHEPIIVASKPREGTYANNALTHGCGALNIDGCRVGFEVREWRGMSVKQPDTGTFRDDNWIPKEIQNHATGRFPANIIHDGSDEVVALFPDSGNNWRKQKGGKEAFWNNGSIEVGEGGYQDSGSAARFFYCAKASRSERGEGNTHPTVKPLALIKYLCKLVQSPSDTLILDPFCGSGTTAIACEELGLRWVAIDQDEKSCEIAAKRLERLGAKQPELFATG